MTIRPGEAESSNETRATLFRRLRAALDQQSLDTIHGRAKILVGAGPTRGMDAGLAAKRINDQTGIVGKCGLVARACGSARLDARVLSKSRTCFFRLRKTEFAGGLCGDSVRRKQLTHFPEFARIMGSDNHRTAQLSGHLELRPLTAH